MTALQSATVLTCIDIVSSKISSLPHHIYARSINSTGRAIHRIAYDHDYYDLINLEPNPEMSAQTFLRAYLCHCLLWGNGYAEIQRNAGNAAVGFWPRNPSKTKPRRMITKMHLDPVPWRPFPVDLLPGDLVFESSDSMGIWDQSDEGAQRATPIRIIPKEDMLHVPGLSLDGRIGQQPIWLAREVIGLDLAMGKFGAKYFANFAKPGGLLELPQIKAEDREQAKRSWMEAQGGENAHRVAVMPTGTKWTSISNNPQESQTLDQRQFVRTQIAALFHVPTRMVGDTQRQSKASTEQENQELLDYTLQPWMHAIKQEWKRKLFPHPNTGRRPKSPFYLDFETWEMVRGDAAAREKFYASGRQWAYLNTNDIRAFEKLNPIDEPWAEEYWIPVNMTLTTTPINPNSQSAGGGADNEPRGFKDRDGRVISMECVSDHMLNFARAIDSIPHDKMSTLGGLYAEFKKAEAAALGAPQNEN